MVLVITALYLMPLLWMVLNSFKPDVEIFRSPPTFWPESFTLSGYLDQMKGDFWKYFKNSLMIATLSTAVSLVLGIPAAYGLARFRAREKRTIILGFLITQMLPPALLLTPLYLLYSNIHLTNTLAASILSTATLSIPFMIIMLRPFFSSLPKALEDAARTDGCNMFTAFVRIMLPVSKTGIFTAATFSFVFAWSDLIYSTSFIQNGDYWPLTTMINDFQTKYGTKWNSILAFGVCLMLPVLILFFVTQKYVIMGLTTGAVKE